MSKTVIGNVGNISAITSGVSPEYYISNTNTAMTIEQAGRVELKGKNADVVINGVSLSATLQGIQDRLCMLQPNAALEAEWAQLQELGKQYRRTEADLLEKQRAWKILTNKVDQ